MKVIDHGVFFSFFDHLYGPIKLVLLLFISKKLHLELDFSPSISTRISFHNLAPSLSFVIDMNHVQNVKNTLAKLHT